MRSAVVSKNKHLLFLIFSFLILFAGYTVNLWKVSTDLFYGFDRAAEGLVIGRLIKSDHDGVFSAGGLTGLVYEPSDKPMDSIIAKAQTLQHVTYIEKNPMPEGYRAYKSQNGAHGILYSVLQIVLPFNNTIKLQIFRFINAGLTAFVFVLFLGWVRRNFGLASGVTCLLFLALSPLVNNFTHSLWWPFWSFYVPLLGLLLLLEKLHKSSKPIFAQSVLWIVYVTVFIKCFFSGFEFITSVLLMIFCPIIYYSYLERKKLTEFIAFCFKSGLCALAGVLTSMLILIVQIKDVLGSFEAGAMFIIESYTKRSSQEVFLSDHGIVTTPTLGATLMNYLNGNAFELGFLPENFPAISYWVLLALIVIASCVLFATTRNFAENIKRSDVALILTTAFSVLCPLSWYIIFKQHAAEHPHLDYIVWYMPFLLFGFVLVGRAISVFITIKK